MASVRSLLVLAAVLALSAGSALAQPLGTFRWQLQSFCNVLTLVVVQNASVFTLDGYDDQCGAPTRAPVTGIATPNPNGTIGFGLNLVLVPGATPLHVDATITLATLGGTWRDSGGNTGNFVLTPGSGTGGSPRPAPVAVFPEGINAGLSRLVNVAPPVSPFDAATKGWVEGLVPPNRFTFQFDGGFLALGPGLPGLIPETGPGTRMMWYPSKAAFRVGSVSATRWDDSFVGTHSIAMGRDTMASGHYSLAVGFETTANGLASTALGAFASTNGHQGSFVYGDNSSSTPVTASAMYQFTVRAAGGTRFFSSANLSTGVTLAPGGGAWATVSDVNTKQHFRDLDGDDVLARLARMPIREWSYKAQNAAIRHAGPTAQDFHAAFGLGEDPLKITTTDADGIALRAIQALEERTRRERETMQAEIDSLKRSLADLISRRR